MSMGGRGSIDVLLMGKIKIREKGGLGRGRGLGRGSTGEMNA
jgi:hypothetical protein